MLLVINFYSRTWEDFLNEPIIHMLSCTHTFRVTDSSTNLSHICHFSTLHLFSLSLKYQTNIIVNDQNSLSIFVLSLINRIHRCNNLCIYSEINPFQTNKNKPNQKQVKWEQNCSIIFQIHAQPKSTKSAKIKHFNCCTLLQLPSRLANFVYQCYLNLFLRKRVLLGTQVLLKAITEKGQTFTITVW